MGWVTARCRCGKTAGHVVVGGSAAAKCWPTPLRPMPSVSRVAWPDPNSEAAQRIRAEWAHLEQ